MFAVSPLFLLWMHIISLSLSTELNRTEQSNPLNIWDQLCREYFTNGSEKIITLITFFLNTFGMSTKKKALARRKRKGIWYSQCNNSLATSLRQFFVMVLWVVNSQREREVFRRCNITDSQMKYSYCRQTG